jgi:hypothetical protein
MVSGLSDFGTKGKTLQRTGDKRNIQDNPGEENVTQIVRSDSRLTASKTAEELNTNREAVILILTEDLKRRKPLPK